MTNNSAQATIFSQMYIEMWNKIALEYGVLTRQKVVANFQSLIDLRISFKSYNPFKPD